MAGWYEPLNKYLDNANLTPPDYNWKDFGPAGTYWGLKGDGTIVAIPMGVGLGAYMYRKDLYAEKGLKPTTTVDELIAAVKALAQAARGVRLRRARSQERQHPGVGLPHHRARAATTSTRPRPSS